MNLNTVPYIRALDMANLRMSMSREGYMTRNSAGELFFIDSNNMKKIYKLGLDGMIRPWVLLPYDAMVLDCDVLNNVYALCYENSSTTRIYKAIEGGSIVQIPTAAVPGFIWDIRVDKDLNIWALLANYGWAHDQLWRINADGTAHPVVGHQSASSSPESVLADPVPAAKAFLTVYHHLRLDAKGRPLFSDNYSYSALGLSGDRIRRLDPDGLIRTVVDCRRDGSLPMDPGSGENYIAVNQVNAFYLYDFFLDETGEQLYLVGKRPGSDIHDVDVFRLSEKVLYFSSDLRYRYDKTTRTLDDLRTGERFLFDADGRQVERADLDGNTTGTGWDAQGKLVSVTDPKGGVTQLQYSDGTHLSRIVDPLGRETTFVINGAGDLTRVTLPDASVVQFEYNATHHITARTGADGRRTDYAWGGDGTRIASITFADGSVRQYAPDPENASVTDGNGHTWLYSADYTTGRVRTVTDPLGNATVKEHDPAGRVARVTEPGGRIREYGYDVMGNLIRETLLPANQTRRWAYHSYTGLPVSSTDELGRVTTFSYDTHRHLASRTTPDGAVTSYTYTADGLLASQTDPLGNTTTYEYDLRGNLSKVTDPLGHFSSLTHDAAGNILSATDPNGNTTAYTYDVINRKLTQTDPLGNTTTWTYVPSGKKGGCSTCAGGGDKVATVTDPLGNVTRFDYDSVGNLTKVTDPLGFFRTMTYDFNRNLISATEEEGRVTTMEYDSAGRLIKTTRPGGIVAQTAYDADGRVTSSTDPLGRVTGFEYDSAGRLSASIDPLGGRTTFTYDAAGNRLSVTDAKNHATTFTYDALNRPLTETDPLGRTRSRTYDVAGRLASTTDAKGQTITFNYDNAGRLTLKIYPGSTQETYTYDNNGNLLRAVNPDVSTAYTYDPRNLQLTIKNETIDKTVSYTYDAAGRKVSLTYPDGERIEYARDTRGQVSVLSSNGDGGLGPMTQVLNYVYNPTGALSTMDYAFGMHVSRTYNPATGRLVDLKYAKLDASVISDFAYTHDLVGNILTKTTDFGLITYSYDAKNQLTSALYSWKPAETFAYDAVGNRTLDVGNPVWQYDAGNQLLAYGAGTHDPIGQNPPTTPVFTFTYDANGSTITQTPTVGDTFAYAYNSENRMSGVQKNGEQLAAYAYDHQAQRVRKTLYSGGSPTSTTWFIYGQEGLLAEYDATGTILNKVVWQPDRPWGTSPLWQQEGIFNRNYFVDDHFVTPVKLIDSGYNSLWSSDFSAFGRKDNLIGAITCNLRFPGQYHDTETDNAYNFHRFYSSKTGRYLEKDPVYRQSVYSYVYSSPVNYFDPYGLYCLPDFVLNYFSSGSPVYLEDLGLAGEWRYSAPVAEAINQFQSLILNDAYFRAVGICRKCRRWGQESYEKYSRDYTNLTLESPCLFSFGRGFLEQRAFCNLYVNCETRRFDLYCFFRYSTEDRFEKPILDTWDIPYIGHPFELRANYYEWGFWARYF